MALFLFYPDRNDFQNRLSFPLAPAACDGNCLFPVHPAQIMTIVLITATLSPRTENSRTKVSVRVVLPVFFFPLTANTGAFKHVSSPNAWGVFTFKNHRSGHVRFLFLKPLPAVS